MKRLLIPLAAASLSAAALAIPAEANPHWATDDLAPKPVDAYGVAQFWLGANGAALRKATQYHWDAKDVTKLVAARGEEDGAPDGKPGMTAPTGNPKPASSKNVNLPKTIGKVFFVDHEGRYNWCSATSIQARHRNLVATAGHCVYEKGKDVFEKWVFVPGYYQGKAPWGIYAGAYAFTAYDLDVYDDYDGDFAFVAVHNGILDATAKPTEVTKAKFEAYDGPKWTVEEKTQVTKAQYEAYLAKPQNDKTRAFMVPGTEATLANPGGDGALYTPKEVSESAYGTGAATDPFKIPTAEAKNNTPAGVTIEYVTKAQYDAYLAAKKAGKEGYLGRPISGDQVANAADGKAYGPKYDDANGPWAVVHFFIKQWIVPGKDAKYYLVETHYFTKDRLKDAGRLGDVVGGQGFAWNQPRGQKVTVFGYPGDPHPDGDKPYTGVTPKWCSGKTGTKTYQVNTFRVEEHQVLKCSMTGGSDGGPWLMKYDNGKRTGYVNGVTSMFHDQDGNDRIDFISSAYFDGEVADVYNKANYAETKSIVGPNGELLK
ncbi:trypsin-like serine peptidase [Nonomuraea sp. NPDC052265]|uniref:trypsin-like serine peptidase n=1 Tax=Nonomuraea sp. NPDC052265 TaxID=3364374 RepID=UPI0037C729D1